MGTLEPLDHNSTGIIPAAVTDIFSQLRGDIESGEVSINVSMVQVYQDETYDLLSLQDDPVVIKEDYVSGLL